MDLRSQQLSFFKPDKLKQLPSSETYNIMQDSRGYIWFSSESGLCKYNGKSFKVFNAVNGLPESGCYAMIEDKKGNLWIATSRNRILAYKNDGLKEAAFSPSLSIALNEVHQQINRLYFVTDSVLILNTQRNCFKINIFTNTFQKIDSSASIADYVFSKEQDAFFPIKTKLSTVQFNDVLHRKSMFVALYIKNKRNQLYIPFTKTTFSGSQRVVVVNNKKGECFIAFNDVLLKINKDLSYKTFSLNSIVVSMYADSNDGLWVGTEKGGVTYYPHIGLDNEENIQSLKGLTVSGICEDHERGIWCSTLEKGIFYCRSKEVIDYTNVKGLNDKVNFLKTINQQIFTFSEELGLLEIKNNLVNQISLSKQNLALTGIIDNKADFIISDKTFTAKSNHTLSVLSNLKVKGVGLTCGMSQMTKINNNRIFGIQYVGIYEIKNNFMHLYTVLPSSGRCILYTKNYGLLAGCREGIYQVHTEYNDTSIKRLIELDPTKMLEIANDEIFITTKDSGVFIVSANKKMTKLIDLPKARYFDVVEDRFNTIWLASDQGVIKLVKINGKFQSIIYNTLNGLLDNEIFHLAAGSDRLYLSTSDGICSIPLKQTLLNVYPSPIYIDSLSVNGKNVFLKEIEKGFAFNENNFEVGVEALTYKNTVSPIEILYRLSDTGAYYKAKDGYVFLNALKDGPYYIQLYALNNNNIRSKIPAELRFEIRKPFWKNIFCILLMLAIVALIIFIITKLIVRRIKKKEQEKTLINKQLAEYHMSALRAQMNPHFIFNCINSIQRYILTNKPEEAYDYLSKFSKLIRHVLNYAEEDMITLAQEIEIVELYLELEQKRFEHKFTYSIIIVNDFDIHEVCVPVLLMQPYIENSIWHGLMNLNNKAGHIDIRIKLDIGILQIDIEDNGIGRLRAGELSKGNHKSKAININKIRSEIMSSMANVDPMETKIEDVLNEKGKVAGTRVIIKIPQYTNTEDE